MGFRVWGLGFWDAGLWGLTLLSLMEQRSDKNNQERKVTKTKSGALVYSSLEEGLGRIPQATVSLGNGETVPSRRGQGPQLAEAKRQVLAAKTAQA